MRDASYDGKLVKRPLKKADGLSTWTRPKLVQMDQAFRRAVERAAKRRRKAQCTNMS
jgi:hypothetical protein